MSLIKFVIKKNPPNSIFRKVICPVEGVNLKLSPIAIKCNLVYMDWGIPG